MLISNLLPEEEKKIIRTEEARRLVIFFVLGIIVIFLIASFLLLPSYVPLYLEQRELGNKLSLEEEAVRKLKVQETIALVRSQKASIASIINSLGTSGRASVLMRQFLGSAGAGVVLQNLTVQRDGTVFLRGTARTRQMLLGFEKALRDSGQLQEISSPISNIIHETNIDFVIQGKLKSTL